CGGTSTRTYQFTATDGCGNSASRTATFTTVDTQAPVLVGVPADLILDCSQPIPPVPTVIADDCNPNIVVMFNQTTQPINGNGTVSVIVRTWTANDGCGNISTGRQTITVLDNTPPTVSNCPGNIGPIVSPNGACVVVNWVPPTFNDNCGSGTLVVTSTHNPGFCFPVGTTTVVYTATDLGGNVTTFSFNVTIS